MSRLDLIKMLFSNEDGETFNKCSKAYEKGRADAIDDVERELLANGFIFTEHALEVWHNIAEQLKGQKND